MLGYGITRGHPVHRTGGSTGYPDPHGILIEGDTFVYIKGERQDPNTAQGDLARFTTWQPEDLSTA